ncbi:MAG: hypothetical protein LKI24_03130 [Acidipropionibacterium sp.]|jgi:hypothetical protein|nr:hypothetical protein [Acidipropionibacterium sp.]
MSHDIDADRMGTLDHADLVAPEDAGDQAKQIALAAQEWLGRARHPSAERGFLPIWTSS